MNKGRLEFFSQLTLCLIGVLVGGFLFFRYLFLPLLPFLIAWCAALVLRPLAAFLSARLHIPRRVVSIVLTVLSVCVGLGGIIALTVYGIGSAWEFLSELAADEEVFDILSKITNPIGALFGESEAAAALEERMGEAVREAMSSLVGRLVGLLTDVISSVPRVLFFILITVISAIYFAADVDGINARVLSLLPQKVGRWVVNMKQRFFSAGLKYLRSYLIIMLITALEILIGLLILRVNKPLLLALLISLLDMLPVIGVGTVLVPWSVFHLLFGSLSRGIGLAVLFAVNVILRQLIEPKILGKSLGIHPIISLVLLYLGYSVLGLFGLLLVPLFAVVLNILLDKKNSAQVGKGLS